MYTMKEVPLTPWRKNSMFVWFWGLIFQIDFVKNLIPQPMFNFWVVMGKMLFFTNIAMNKAYNVRGFYRKNICLIIPYSKIDSRLRPAVV